MDMDAMRKKGNGMGWDPTTPGETNTMEALPAKDLWTDSMQRLSIRSKMAWI